MAILLAALAKMLEEELVLLSRAGNTLPDRVHCSTPRRWASKGLRGVRLEVIDVGGRVYTSHQALARFFARLTVSRPGRQEQSSTQRERQESDAAERATAIYGPMSSTDDPPLKSGVGEDLSRSRRENK